MEQVRATFPANFAAAGIDAAGIDRSHCGVFPPLHIRLRLPDMCGITGKFNFDRGRSVDPERLRAMTSAIAHRGPDADGFHLAEGVGLGHRRLSIIDLATGDQPLSNEDGTIWVVFNGEIYNFAELRVELERAGHRFRTHTDTEVIVHAYEEWGELSVERFRGMFAYALWDDRQRRLVLVRDRLGVKPLFYCPTPFGVTFASEIKALLEDPDVPRDWRPESIDAYLTLQYVPTPGTIYQDIWKLPPGHLLVAQNGKIATRQYWDLIFTGDGDPRREAEYLERLDGLISESVKLRLISEVPLGAFLSGGIDSSAVVAAMVEASTTRVITMSVGFEEQGFNEIEYARVVARHLGTESYEKIVTPDVASLLPKLAWYFDEPFADASAVPTYYVSAAAREHVTVALSGDGGDELWAGYARHRVERWETTARQWLGPAGRLAGHLAGYVPLGIKGARSLRHLALSPADAYAAKHTLGLIDMAALRALYTHDFALRLRDSDPFAGFRQAYDACKSPDPVDRALYVDVKTYLLDDILTKVDKMSMAVSLEARDPLLDHKLLEFAATVPSSLKLKNGRSKYLLRRVLERRMPRSIVERPKQGFEAPIAAWLRGPLAPMVDDLFLDGRFRARGIFDEQAVASLWREHKTGAADHRHRLWSLVMLELWFRQFADRSSVSEIAA
jgi:asparagine synthase (glutamine-hydrolysing)